MGLVVAIPSTQGGVAGVGKKKLAASAIRIPLTRCIGWIQQSRRDLVNSIMADQVADDGSLDDDFLEARSAQRMPAGYPANRLTVSSA